MPLTSSQWQQVEDLFSLAMQMPVERRIGWRRSAGAIDTEVGNEVDALITTCDEGIRFAAMATTQRICGRARGTARRFGGMRLLPFNALRRPSQA
jgi:hypothetical protein